MPGGVPADVLTQVITLAEKMDQQPLAVVGSSVQRVSGVQVLRITTRSTKMD